MLQEFINNFEVYLHHHHFVTRFSHPVEHLSVKKKKKRFFSFESTNISHFTKFYK